MMPHYGMPHYRRDTGGRFTRVSVTGNDRPVRCDDCGYEYTPLALGGECWRCGSKNVYVIQQEQGAGGAK